MTDTSGYEIVSQFQFSALFSASWYRAMTVRNIVAGFKITGVYPFNPKAIVVQSTNDKFVVPPGIAYLPLFSPPKHGRNKECESPESSHSPTLSLTSTHSYTSVNSSLPLSLSPSPPPPPSACDLHEDVVYKKYII